MNSPSPIRILRSPEKDITGSDVKSVNGHSKLVIQQHSPTSSMIRMRSESNINKNLVSQYFNRKSHFQEIKKLLKDIANLQMRNKLLNLTQELFLDAEYRERTSNQLREKIISMEQIITKMQHSSEHRYRGGHSLEDASYILHLEESLRKYERIID